MMLDPKIPPMSENLWHFFTYILISFINLIATHTKLSVSYDGQHFPTLNPVIHIPLVSLTYIIWLELCGCAWCNFMSRTTFTFKNKLNLWLLGRHLLQRPTISSFHKTLNPELLNKIFTCWLSTEFHVFRIQASYSIYSRGDIYD